MVVSGSSPAYEMTVERDVEAEMPDGTRLVVDVYRPDADGSFPAVLTMTPYGKDIEDSDVAPRPYGEGAGEFAMIEGTNSEFWARRGYAHVIADVRGTGKSEGQYNNILSEREAEDGYYLVEWMADQSWCDGSIGMVGISYLAIIQYIVAATQPPHLEAIFPHDGWGDSYRDIMYHGGIQSAFFKLQTAVSDHSPAIVSRDLFDEEELESKVADLLSDDETNVNKSPLLKEVLTVPEVNPIWFDMLLNREDAEFWQGRRPASVMDQIDVPVYLGSEMHKYPVCMHLPGAAHWGWENIESETKLAFRPKVPKRPFKGDYHQEMLRWYDYHLKGIDNGVMDEPPVQIWVRGADRFRYADEWPLRSETQWKEYYLQYPGRLRSDGPPPADEPTTALEYEAQPPGAIFGTNAASGEPDHVSFTTDPFESDTEVVGPMALYLHASIDTTDAHFIAVVKDVEPDGTNRILTRGWLKASHRELDAEQSERWRPYHPHTDPQPVEPGAIERYAIEIQPIANRFEAGHRLQLEIWPMDYPAEDYYDQTLLWGRVHHIPHGEDVTYDLYHDSSRPSHLLLPVVDES